MNVPRLKTLIRWIQKNPRRMDMRDWVKGRKALCLGVLCEVVGADPRNQDKRTTPNLDVQEKAGIIDEVNGFCRANDQGQWIDDKEEPCSFYDIADAIEFMTLAGV